MPKWLARSFRSLALVGLAYFAGICGAFSTPWVEAQVVPLITSWLFTGGALVQDSTSGGNIIMPKASTGLIQGESSISATAASVVGNPAYMSVINVNGTGNSHIGIVGNGASIYGGILSIMKTRAATDAATTIVQNGDELFEFNAWGADGSVYRRAAEILMTVDGAPGSGDMPGAIDFLTTADGGTTLASALKLSNDKSAQFTGTIKSSRTTDLGWSVQSAADQACNTTCTSACVLGFNLTAGNITGTILACTDATADVCLCAGAS